MPLDYGLKGKEYGRLDLAVDRQHVLRFCDAIGETAAIFRDPVAAKEAGFDEQLAPATFPTVLQIMASAQVVADPELGLNYMLVVHAEQEYEYRRPIRVGDRLWTVPRIADAYARGRHEYLVLEADVKDEIGETVVVARTTLLSRGTAGS